MIVDEKFIHISDLQNQESKQTCQLQIAKSELENVREDLMMIGFWLEKTKITLRHFRYRKVTPELLKRIQELRLKGKSYQEIAELCRLACSTVAYHLNVKQREKDLNRARKALTKKKGKPKSQKEKEYAVTYYKDRYHRDEEFRRKVIKANMGGRFKNNE